jgi:hypothetical protein
MHQAILLDKDSRHLSSVEVQLRMSEGRGLFWLQESVSDDTVLRCAAILRMSEGHTIRIHRLQLCSDPLPPRRHFHFELEG